MGVHFEWLQSSYLEDAGTLFYVMLTYCDLSFFIVLIGAQNYL